MFQTQPTCIWEDTLTLGICSVYLPLHRADTQCTQGVKGLYFDEKRMILLRQSRGLSICMKAHTYVQPTCIWADTFTDTFYVKVEAY